MVSTVFGFKLLCCFVTFNLAFEKILSADDDVAVIFSNEWAIFARIGNRVSYRIFFAWGGEGGGEK